MGWATFWAIFSQSHLVALVSAFGKQEQAFALWLSEA
jgi:hypothetical protein